MLLPTSLCMARHYACNRPRDVTLLAGVTDDTEEQVIQASATKRSDRADRLSAFALVA